LPQPERKLAVKGVSQLATALLVGSVAAVSAGQSLIDAENLLIAQPPGFKVGYQSGHDHRSITEYVPVTETVDEWTQMLTVQVFRHATVDSATFLQGIGKRYMGDCPGTTAKGIFTGTINGYVVSMLVLKCPNNPGNGQTRNHRLSDHQRQRCSVLGATCLALRSLRCRSQRRYADARQGDGVRYTKHRSPLSFVRLSTPWQVTFLRAVPNFSLAESDRVPQLHR
jgi:hypothetical protein